MKEPLFGRLLLMALGLIIMIAPIAAATVTISPDTIQENTPITVSVKNLADNSTFMIRVEASIPLDADGKFSLSTNNLQMPFALNDGAVSIRAEDVEKANFSARMGGRAVTIFGDSEDGVVTINQPGDIPEGLISYITLDGTGAAGADTVTATVDLSGKKVGASDADITFTVTGFNGGSVNVKIYVDGSLAATIPVTTPTTTTSSSGGDDTATTTTAAPETETISSLDGMATLTFESDALEGASADDLTIMVSNRAVPEEWTAVAGPFAILPSDATFSPAADFSIEMTEEQAESTAPYTILGYIDGSWTALQSQIDDDTITTSITEAGEYALVTPYEETTVVTTPATTAPVETTTVIPATTTGVPTTTTPAASPLPLTCALGALAVAGLLYRKHS